MASHVVPFAGLQILRGSCVGGPPESLRAALLPGAFFYRVGGEKIVGGIRD